MLDTIVLILADDQFEIMDHEKFTPSSRGVFEQPYYPLRPGSPVRCQQNPSRDDMLRGHYKPRLTLIKSANKGGYFIILRIEFSAPKLVFGNNFYEVTTQDYGRLEAMLWNRLMEMGVEVSRDSLSKAKVSTIHYSKNFLLPRPFTSSMLISEIGKLNLNSRLDLNKTRYRNEGHSVCFHANSYEVMFYDKIQDLKQARMSEKRSIEKEYLVHLKLQEGQLLKGLEVFRMETRLGKRSKIQAMFKALNIKAGLIFSELFSAEISQKILLYFWDYLRRDLNLLAMEAQRPEDVFRYMLRQANLKESQALKMLGAYSLMQSIGIRGLKQLLPKTYSRSEMGLKKSLKKCLDTGDIKFQIVAEIEQALKIFSPLTCHFDTQKGIN